MDRDIGTGRRGRPDRGRGIRLDPDRRRTLSPSPLRGPHPCRTPTGIPPRDRDAEAASRMGLWTLEEPRRLRAPGRCRGRLARIPPQRPAARRDRDRLSLGDAIQHLALQPSPVPGRPGHGEGDARRRCPHGGLGDAVGQPRVRRRPAASRPGIREAAQRAGCQLRRGRGCRPLRAGGRGRVLRRSLVDGHGVDRRLHLGGGTGMVVRALPERLRARCRGRQGRRRRGLLLPARLTGRRRAHRRRDGLGVRAPLPRDDPARARRGARGGQRRGLRPFRVDRSAGDRDALGR